MGRPPLLLLTVEPSINVVFFETPLADRFDRRDLALLHPIIDRALFNPQVFRNFIDRH